MQQPKERRLGYVGRIVLTLMAVGALYMTHRAATYFSEQSTVQELDALCTDTDDIQAVFDAAVAVGTDVRVFPSAHAVDFWRPSRLKGVTWVCAFVRTETSSRWTVTRTRDWVAGDGYDASPGDDIEKLLDELLLAE